MLGILSVIIVFLIIYQTSLIRKYRHIYKDEVSHVAALTHDLKSPTLAQISMLDLLLNEKFGKLNSEQQEMLALTRNSAKYVSNLVGTILSDYNSKISSLKQLNKTVFDVVRLINSVLKRYEYIINEKDLKINFNHLQCIKICADELQIERVITNLISNALIYSQEKSAITINLSGSNNFVNFTIVNKSNYINKKELKNIFNKYSRTVNSKLNKVSTGLGLYAAKRIVSLHGGQIYAKSTKDGTCTFGFALPDNVSANDFVA